MFCHKAKNDNSKPRGAAFTLIELLVVIAIVAILAGILIPAMGGVRERSYSAISQSNLRQIAIIAHRFASDNKGRYPQCHWWGSGGDNWLNVVHNDINGRDLSFHNREETPLEDTILWSPVVEYTNDSSNHSYGFNWVMTKMGYKDSKDDFDGVQGPLSINFETPSRTVMVADSNTNNGILGWGDGVAFRNHGDVANVVFFDGHVEALTREDVPENWNTPEGYRFWGRDVFNRRPN